MIQFIPANHSITNVLSPQSYKQKPIVLCPLSVYSAYDVLLLPDVDIYRIRDALPDVFGEISDDTSLLSRVETEGGTVYRSNSVVPLFWKR